jgi:hypothetical protein
MRIFWANDWLNRFENWRQIRGPTPLLSDLAAAAIVVESFDGEKTPPDLGFIEALGLDDYLKEGSLTVEENWEDEDISNDEEILHEEKGAVPEGQGAEEGNGAEE